MGEPDSGARLASRRTRGLAWASLVLACLTTVVLVVEDRAGLFWPRRDVEFYQGLAAMLLLCGVGLRVAALAAGAFALVRLGQPPRDARHVAVAVCGVIGATMAEWPARVAACVCCAVGFPVLAGVGRGLLIVLRGATAMCRMEEPRVSRMAIASLVLGGTALVLTLIERVFSALWLGGTYEHIELGMWLMLGGMPLSPLAVVLGSVAIVQIKEQPGRLRGMSLAMGGIASGVVTLTGGLGFAMLAYVVAALSPVAGVVALVRWLKRRGERARATQAAPVQAEEVGSAPAQAQEDAEAHTVDARRAPIGGLAVAALVLGVLTLPTFGLAGPVGVIVGIAALVGIRLSRGRVRGIGLALAGIALSAGGFALVAYPMFMKEKASAQKAVCLSNVKRLSLAALDYAEDHGGVLPAADDWCDSLLPYVDGPKTFRCPRAHEVTCAYAFNSALGGMRLDDIADPAGVIMIFESDAGWNASGGLKLLAEEPRHIGGDDYGFADGHAAWMNRAQVLSADSRARWELGVAPGSSGEETSVGAGD